MMVLVAQCADSIRQIHSKGFTERELTVDDRLVRDDTLASFDKWKLSITTRLREVLDQKFVSSTSKFCPSSIERETSSYGLFAIPNTSLTNLTSDVKKTVLSSILLLSLSLPSHNYDPRSRTMLHILSASLQLPPTLLPSLEKQVAKLLVSAAMKADEEEGTHRTKSSSSSRKWKMGMAGLAGGILVGVTGYFLLSMNVIIGDWLRRW